MILYYGLTLKSWSERDMGCDEQTLFHSMLPTNYISTDIFKTSKLDIKSSVVYTNPQEEGVSSLP
jgi:hypothetical protein